MNPLPLAESREARRLPTPLNRAPTRYDLIVVDPTGSLGYALAAEWSRSLGAALVIADEASDILGDEVAARGMKRADLITTPTSQWPSSERLVLILPRLPSSVARGWLASCREIAKNAGARRILVISDFVPPLPNSESNTRWEAECLQALRESSHIEVASLLVGRVVDPARQFPRPLARWSVFAPLIPITITGVFPTLEELRATLESLFAATPDKFNLPRSLLGANRPWREVLAEFKRGRGQSSVGASFCQLAAFLGARQLIAILVSCLTLIRRCAGVWQIATLSPTSVAELVRLYRAPNHRYIALAGHNTGVVHFGWKYPGRTVVRTTRSGKRIRARDNLLTVDAGVTLKQVTETLREQGKELLVVPNYSYIGMGTCYMVPIHGSGSQVSTLGDSIEEVLVYDPSDDRLHRARRGDGRFERWMYHPASGVLVLRLQLKIRDQTHFQVRRRLLENPDAYMLWRLLTRATADNIELRKANGKSAVVEVNEYFAAGKNAVDALEAPRDKIGRIWDRIEENRVAAWLFHAYVRNFGHHVELFLDEPEFATFWQAHSKLPLAKIQLRIARRDGLPHSPFGDGDRVSVDLFLKRSQRALFAAFLEEHLPHARINPGKHSP